MRHIHVLTTRGCSEICTSRRWFRTPAATYADWVKARQLVSKAKEFRNSDHFKTLQPALPRENTK